MTDTITYREDGSAQSFVGRGAVEVFRAVSIATALILYARTGMKANRMYTPKNMMAAAHGILGDAAKGVKTREYLKMATLLSSWAQSEKARIGSENLASQGGQQ